MAKFYIDYRTGAGNKWVEGTLEETMKIADEGITYTQQDVDIENEAGHIVAYRAWWRVPYDYDLFNENEDDIINFGSAGHYSAWTEICPLAAKGEERSMERYYVNYHTGAGNQWVEGPLHNAMIVADTGVAYTQQNMSIEDEKGREVAVRVWYGTPYGVDADYEQHEAILFGGFGHYGPWIKF